jgi:hypothetical protein
VLGLHNTMPAGIYLLNHGGNGVTQWGALSATFHIQNFHRSTPAAGPLRMLHPFCAPHPHPPAGIDLLNHGGTSANGQLVLGKASWQLEGEPAVCFVTTQHITAGQQVCLSCMCGAQLDSRGGGVQNTVAVAGCCCCQQR